MQQRIEALLSKYGLTDFQKLVLVATSSIPKGKTATYKEIAKRIGKPKAYRAVGNALAANPLPVVIPCHRVIKSNGSVGSYSRRGGAAAKLRLLKRENASSLKGL